ncbi:hypothetical protein TRFO_13070 [Tritrichomonas foetus]|uniref:Uncharacterized protein n=1 Tax=Tritrichomonas foetus TaxID=1144522 RepID=A0A1J4L0I1_9EUKA|nr:hypothetical protein TRFO_13070 [Tritrichomonas foetus]|eukprot:OHT16640.1 hypothetical protein TRFO_13070 [Tritrichomonas foetus]
MHQTLHDNNDEWDAQIAERRLALVNEDIEAAQKQIASLEKQKIQLNREYLNLEFTLNELQSNLEDLENANQVEDENDDDDEDTEGTFFTILSELESEEAALRGELQSYKDLQRDLGHQKGKYAQQNLKMQKDLEFEKERLENEEMRLRESLDTLNTLQEEYDQKSSLLNGLIQSCEELENEERLLSEELQRQGENVVKDLKLREAELKKELEQALKQEENLKKLLANNQRKLQNHVDELSSKLNKNQSIASWKNDRALLAGKLRKAKQQLVVEMASLNTARQRREDLAVRCKTLLGEDDPGDATGMRAKQMVRAEIESLGLQKQPEVDEEAQIETQYFEELNEQLKLIDNSIIVFTKHRNDTLASLNDELQECSQDGYIRLLKSEMDELQAAVSRF